RLHRRGPGDGRGAAGGADRGRQPARAHDAGRPGAGPCPGPGRSGSDDCLRARAEELRLMARINLLPWRAERRAQRQKDFGVMIALSLLAGVLLWFLVNGYYNAQIEGQQARNTYMDQQIAQVDETIKEIEELDRQRGRL